MFWSKNSKLTKEKTFALPYFNKLRKIFYQNKKKKNILKKSKI